MSIFEDDDELYIAEFDLSNSIKMDIVHTVPTYEELNAAFTNWLIRHQDKCSGKEQAEASFCDYINSKGSHLAMPKKLFYDGLEKEN